MSADTSYPQDVVQIRQDGNLAVPSGKSIDVESGASLKLAGTALTVTSAELNALASAGLSATELGYLNGVVAGTATASKALVVGADKNIDTLVIAASGLKIGAGAGTAVTTTAAQLNQVTDAAGTVTFDRLVKVARVALAAVGTGGGVLAWQNPEATAILINRLIVDVTTAATGACTVDFGTTATSATTLSDTLLDGLDVNAAIGTFDNITDVGTNGKSRQKLAAAKWVTGSVASGTVTGLVGFAYIHYTTI